MKIIKFFKVTAFVIPSQPHSRLTWTKKFVLPTIVLYYGNDYGFRLKTNCYGFATGVIYDKQPNNIIHDQWDTQFLQTCVSKDKLEIVSPDYKCQDDEYKIMGFTSEKPNEVGIKDYHFYRSIGDIWYHKFVYEAPTCLDSIGNIITNPLTSNNNYDTGNYNVFSVCCKVKKNNSLFLRIYYKFFYGIKL